MYGSEHGVMCCVVDVGGMATSAVREGGHATLALVGVALEGLSDRHACFLEGRNSDVGVGQPAIQDGEPVGDATHTAPAVAVDMVCCAT